MLPDPRSVTPYVNLHRTWVSLPQFRPSENVGIQANDVMWELDQDEVYQMIMDVNLTPKLPTAKTHPCIVVQAAWSPGGVLRNNRCALGVMSNFGAVSLHASTNMQWELYTDISRQWLEMNQAEWNKEKLVDDLRANFHTLKERVARIKTTSFCWSDLFLLDSTKFGLLITGQASGCILFWRLELTGVARAKPSLALTLDTDLKKISSLHWSRVGPNKGVLLAGDHGGRISSYVLLVSREGLECEHRAEVWPHADRLTVSHITTLPSPRGAVLLATKGTFLVALRLDNFGAVVTFTAQQVGNLNITGVCSLGDDVAMVVTQSGCFSEVTVHTTGSGEMTTSIRQLGTDKNLTHWAAIGLSISHNRAFCAVAYRLCKAYDHLIRREPGQIAFFKLPHRKDSFTLLRDNPTEELTRYWDHVEAVRLQNISDGFVQGLEFATDHDDLEKYSPYQLRLAAVVLKMFVSLTDATENKDMIQLMRCRLRQMQLHVFVMYLCGRIGQLVDRWRSGLLLSPSDLDSLGLSRLWLRGSAARRDLTGGKMSALIEGTLRLPQVPGETREEFCHICRGDILYNGRPTLSGKHLKSSSLPLR
uniref:Transcription factor IIIC 90kDa subunit N-terminal domain-containing protein n=1 Tax=Timema bartmani TaxID=61472 RepID=A0A7R9F6R0_9NEOP|nr:unnamed protein product [Timema bartmani]